MPDVTPEELLMHAAVYEEKIAYPYMFLCRTADLLRAAATEIGRLKKWLELIEEGCHCTKPDPWAIGQCDCQTGLAPASP